MQALIILSYLVSGVLVVLWMPVFHHFWKGWKERKNPISLAICAATLYFLYSALNTPILLGSSKEAVILVDHAASLIVCLSFYVAFRWAGSRWNPPEESRRKE